MAASLKGILMQQNTTTATPHLSRSLGLWAIVGLGLGYMTPMTVFDTFGIVSEETPIPHVEHRKRGGSR